MSKCFFSDNASGACPEMIEAIAAAGQGPAPAYGMDPLTDSLTERMSEFFERPVEVFLVATGTAANALSLAALTPPWGLVFCHRDAHIEMDECGAPEFFSGGKLHALPGENGKLRVETLEQEISRFRLGVVHESQPVALSLSQATELGTVYTPVEAARLAGWAHDKGLRVHMDGARLANAIVSLGCTPADITWKTGIDILSFGATKNGAIAAEAVVVFDPELTEGLAYRRKRAGHLFSKSRFFAAQFHAYLTDDLWRRNARSANDTAAALASGLKGLDGVQLACPVEANELFVRMPDTMAAALRDQGFQFHDWAAAGKGGRRLVTSWQTTPDDVDGLLHAARGAV